MFGMRHLRSVDQLADRSVVRWVIDVALVVAAVAASLPSLFRDNAHPPALAVPVLVAVAAPLIVRRFFPLPVFGWVLITAVAAGLWNRHVIAGLAVLIALYTVAGLFGTSLGRSEAGRFVADASLTIRYFGV
jgi:hypothetical protein